MKWGLPKQGRAFRSSWERKGWSRGPEVRGQRLLETSAWLEGGQGQAQGCRAGWRCVQSPGGTGEGRHALEGTVTLPQVRSVPGFLRWG